MNKLLIICGQTATGKTALALELAKKFSGEIISADSRQVYTGMDIGTGKDIPVSCKLSVVSCQLGAEGQKLEVGYRSKDGVPMWLVDICEPDYRFNVGEYQKLASWVIADIWKRGKLPIVVGGTGLYIRALTQDLTDMFTPRNEELRQELDKKSVKQLQEELKNLDFKKFNQMNDSDRNNPRRLVRAIEVVMWKNTFSSTSGESLCATPDASLPISAAQDIMWVGMTASKEELFRRIEKRVDDRVKQGILPEINYLLKKGYSWDLPSMSALGYREWRSYFKSLEQISSTSGESLCATPDASLPLLKNQVIEQWKKDEKEYAKRQLTWFKKEKRIVWYDIETTNINKQIILKVKQWYNEKA